MEEFKKQYVDRKCKKNDDDWKEIIEVELDKIDEKEKIVSELNFIQLKQSTLQNKVKAHQIACDYLRDLIPASLDRLEYRGLYNDEQHDGYIMEYTDYLVGEVCKVLEEDFLIEKETKKLFPEIEPTLAETRKPIDSRNVKKKMKMNYPNQFAESEQRQYYIYLRKKNDNCPLVFSCYLTMIWGESYDEYESQMISKYEGIQQKLDVGHLNNEEFEQMVNEELPNPAPEYYSAKIDKPQRLYFSYANDPFKKLMKHQRAFSSGVCLYNELGEIIEKVDRNNRSGVMASYKLAQGYLPERIEKEEDVIKLKIDQMEQSGAKYALIYVYGQDFDRYTANIDELKRAQYRLFDRKSGLNFFKGRFETAMDNLFIMDFGGDNGEDDEERDPRNCIVGCILVYHDEGKGWGFDHLRAQGFGYEEDDSFLKLAGERMAKMHYRGNIKNLLAYWNKKLQEEQQAAANVVPETEFLFSKKEKAPKSLAESNDEDQDSYDKDSEYGEEEDRDSNQSEKIRKNEQSGMIEHESDSQINNAVTIMPDNGNGFIGPIEFNFAEDNHDKIIEKIDGYMEENHPQVKEEYPDGFELLYRKRHVDEEIDVLKNVRDYREIQIIKLIREEDPEEEMQGNEEQDSNAGSDEE